MGREALRTRWVRTEPTVHIVGEQYRKNQRNHSKLKREAVKSESDFIEARKNWVFVPPSNMTLLMRFPEGELVLSIPHSIGSMLIHKKRAHILESNVRPDAVIVADDYEVAYDFFFGREHTQQPSMITMKLLEAVNSDLVTGTVIRLPRETGEQLARFNIAVESTEVATVFVSSEDLS